jgi:hypothetical protein
MRSLLLALALVLLAHPAFAADCGCCGKSAGCADRCCGAIHTSRLALGMKPLCCPPRHKGVTPLVPCGAGCPVAMCHKPVTPLTPCDCASPARPVCHKPAEAVVPDIDCPVEVTLTGTKELIQGGCGCGDSADATQAGQSDASRQ